MKTKIYFLQFFTALLMLPVISLAQGVAINENDSEPDPSAMIDIKSTNKGLLIPRMTQTEIENITNPANGLIVFNTTKDKFFTFIASEVNWKEISYGTSTIVPYGDGSIGTGNSCDNTGVYGDYKTGQALTVTEFVTIDVNVTTIGAYSITTDTVNGYSFSATGVYGSTGIQTVDLAGSGIPLTYQTDSFTVTASKNGGSCSFDILVNVACGSTLTDSRDLQNYNTVQIGTQCWMAENLNIGTMINGSGNQTDNSTIEKYCYDDNTANCDIYGGLYQWDEMMEYTTTEGIQGICPTGWHVPTDDEWCTLENEVDVGTVDCNRNGGGGTDAGGNLKETGTVHWTSQNVGATNSSGFTGLGTGYHHINGTYSIYFHDYTYMWSSDEDGGTNAWRRNLAYSTAQISRASIDKAFGFSVRCIQDEANINQAPAQPSSPSPTDASIDQTVNSTLSWACSDPDGDPLTYDVYFGETNPPALGSSGQTAITYDPGAINNVTTYYWKIVATDNHGNSTEGVVWSFTTGTFGEVYNPATGRTWMDRNLGASQVATSSTDAAAYGDLYQWGRATDGHESRTSATTSTIATTPTANAGNSWDGLFITEGSSPYDWLTPQNNSLWQGAGGINNPCPPGFRLPTDLEWEAERQSWSTNDAAGAYSSPLKLTLAGYRYRMAGELDNVGTDGSYWASTISGSNNTLDLGFSSSYASIYPNNRSLALSIRCIKN